MKVPLKLIFWFTSLFAIAACSTTNSISRSSVPFGDKGEISMGREENEDGLILTIETADPVALRTLLMQGFQLHTYNNIDTTTVIFPSAKDVSDKISHHPGEVKATLQNEREKRPDLRPLVSALNNANVLLVYNNDTTLLQKKHEVKVNPSTGVLSYMFVLPYNRTVDSCFGATLVSKPDVEMLNKKEFDNKNFAKLSIDDRQQPFEVGRNGGNQKTIVLDFNFDNQ